MAQYQRNFYGSSYYGDTNAFSGTYESEEILTEEVLNSTFDITITALLPDVVYARTAPEIVQTSGSWVDSGTCLYTSDANAKLTFTGTADRILISYQGRPDGTDVNVKVTTTVAGGSPVVNNYTFSSVNASIAEMTYLIDSLGYGNQVVEIYLGASNTQPFYFEGLSIRATNLTVETRSRLDSGTWTTYEKLTISLADEGTPSTYTITGTSPSYTGNNKIQVRLWLASSDNTVSPEVQVLQTSAGDINNRTDNGTYLALLDMVSIASSAGVTFQEVVEISATTTIPSGTSLDITTRSKVDSASTIWSARSIPYTSATHRLRLKEGIDLGYVITPVINPASTSPFLRIDQWLGWDDLSYLPEDESGVSITYAFLDEQGTVLYQIDQPKYFANKSFISTNITNKPYRIKITLARRFDRSSAAVESITLRSNLIYEESKVIDNLDFSSVDNANTGKNMIFDMTSLTYTPPAEATQPQFFLEDKTNRPLDVNLYYDSLKDLSGISRPNFTSLATDKVWAETKSTVQKHYQYGGGSAVFSNNDETQMTAAFTPILETDKHYRYFIENGWYDADTGLVAIGSDNASINIHWKSEEATPVAERTQLTVKSSQNAMLDSSTDLTSDIVVGEVTAESTWGTVPWVSDEKIYFGSCNLNDIQGDYIREHDTPISGDSVDTQYVVASGNTYASIADSFGVDEQDVRSMNNALDGSEPAVGKTILIPSRIVLPAIDPAATISATPYQLDIVSNSVRQGAKIVPNSRISTYTLEVIESEVTIVKEEVTRGDIISGKDLLKSARVTGIVGIWDLPNDPVLAVNYQPDLDYVLDGNQVSWLPVGGSSTEPAATDKYYVTYTCMKPSGVRVVIGSNYQEEGGINHVWRSPEIKKFSATVAPSLDSKDELPPVTTWQDGNNPEVEDIEYMIEDNDLWVKTWVTFDPDANKYYANGSLQDRVPKDNWFPTIKTGYYYLGKEEYYLFSEATVFEPAENEIPKAENVTYVEGKFNNAVYMQNAASNLLKNSGFAVTDQFDTIFFRAFNTLQTPTDSQSVAVLGT